MGGNPYVMNRHEPTFGNDPDSWDPERWLVGGEKHKKKLEQSMLTVSYLSARLSPCVGGIERGKN